MSDPETPTTPPSEAPNLTLDGKEAFSHAPRPRKTQPPASAAPEDLAPEDYAQSTGYTYKSRQPKDRGYSSSRKEGRKLKENLRYGQYLEVPKGDQAIFSPQRSRLRTALIVIGILIAIAIIVYFLWELLL